LEADRIKWDRRYSGEEWMFSLTPSRYLARNIERICALVGGRRALDIACGEGRNAIFLAQHGFEVTGIDISGNGLERARSRAAEVGVEVTFLQADLEEYRLRETYDLILNFNFLLRPMIPELIRSLRPGGMILMETILDDPALEGEHSPHFLLKPGELQRLFGVPEGEILEWGEDLLNGTPVANVLFRKTAPVE
jgi:2-polyprenyl-3-methyl-5-hydroxy-6-metoxy-1,4-benzoquinol methylase